MRLFALLVLISCSCMAQSPAFEVASVKRAPPDAALGGGLLGCFRANPESYTCRNSTIARMAFQAYNLKIYQMNGVNDDKDIYNVQARIPAGASNDDVKVMLQNLLAERFKLKFHYEKREIPVYELVVAKDGPKFKESPDAPPAADPPPSPAKGKDPDGFPITSSRPGTGSSRANGLERLTGFRSPLDGLVSMLSNRLQVQVMDATGLTGKYDFVLTYTLDSIAGAPASSEPVPGLPILSALEKQLGLTLRKSKLEIDLFVIDSVDKSAAEN